MRKKMSTKLLASVAAFIGLMLSTDCIADKYPWAMFLPALISNSSSEEPVSPVATHKNVFVSSKTYTGNLGGLSGAHAKCNALASSAGLPGQYLAWLSVASIYPPKDSEYPSGAFSKSTIPYRLLNGAMIASNWNDLTDGSLSKPINIDENGEIRNGLVWTNTYPDGSWIHFVNEHEFCSSYTLASAHNYSPFGNTTQTGREWTFYNNGCTSWACDELLCDRQAHIYCFEQ